MDNGSDFLRRTQGLTRNPLGIIALFISLIYGFACLVLSTSIDNLHSSCERLPLIWFIIIFPVVILIAFILLVIFHHEKLYAPSDFKEDDSFIQTIDKKKIKEKRLEEIKELKSSSPSSADNQSEDELTKTEEKEPETSGELTNMVNDIRSSEENESTKGETQTDEAENQRLLEIYSNSEKWVAQELGLKYKLLFKPNVSIKSANFGTFQLDALGRDNKRVYVIETKYWTADKSEKKLKLSIQQFLDKRQKLHHVLKRPGTEFKVIIAIVFDSLKTVNKNELTSFVTGISPTSSIEFFEYDELKRHYE